MSRSALLARLKNDRFGGELSTPGGRELSLLEALLETQFMRGWNACANHHIAFYAIGPAVDAPIEYVPAPFALDGEGG